MFWRREKEEKLFIARPTTTTKEMWGTKVVKQKGNPKAFHQCTIHWKVLHFGITMVGIVSNHCGKRISQEHSIILIGSGLWVSEVWLLSNKTDLLNHHSKYISKWVLFNENKSHKGTIHLIQLCCHCSKQFETPFPKLTLKITELVMGAK